MMKRKFRRVKEGSFRLGMNMILVGILLLPLPHLTAQTRSVSVDPKATPSAWNTELVLADTTPLLLMPQTTEAPIEKAPSRYQEEQAQLEAERRKVEAKAKVTQQKPQPAQATPTTASGTAPCSKDVSDSEKWEWASKAASAYSIPTSLLAAVWQAESGKQFCTATHSYAGAMGPLQFMPGTWKRYAKDGNGDGVTNVHDARDALFGAAQLLASNGASQGDYRRALLAYNHANWYVSKVLALANL